MPLSRFIKEYPYPAKPGYRLLYSTKKASVALLQEAVLDRAKKGKLTEEETQTLRDLGMLAESQEAERQEMRAWVDEFNRKRTRSEAIIVLNMECNLNCSYCFEGSLKGRRYMTEETARETINYIAKSLVPGREDLFVIFYGGEPLLSLSMMESMAASLRGIAERAGVKFSFGMVTNGTLLTRKTVERLKPLGLDQVQVTLDGPRETHDRMRPYRNGKGSFDRIVKNLRETCDLVKIVLGGNYTRETYREFVALLDALPEEGLTPDRLHEVGFTATMQMKGETALPDFKEGCESVNEPWVREASLFLREEILKRGFPTPTMQPAPCMVEFESGVVMHYDGGIYKCPAFVGKKGLEVGHVGSGIGDYRESHKLDIWKKEECLDCEYLPLCFGGCRLMELMREGEIKDVDCKRPFLDAILEEFLLQDIRYPQGQQATPAG